MKVLLLAFSFASCLTAFGQVGFSLSDRPYMQRTSTLLDGLMAYWPLNETVGSKRLDLGPFGNHLTDSNLVAQTTGIALHSANFTTASNQCLYCSDSASIEGGAFDFTWAFWFYPIGSSTQTIIGKGNGASQDKNAEFRVDYYTQKIYFTVGNGTTSGQANFNQVLNTGSWHYIICDYDSVGHTLGVVVNGQARQSAAYSGGSHATADALVIGGGLGLGTFVSGNICEVGYWKRLLNASEKSELYANRSGHPMWFSSTPLPRFFNLVFVGDSLTIGYGLSAGQDYPSQAVSLIGPPLHNKVNLGVSGYFTTNLIANAATTDGYKGSTYKTNLLTVWIGSNDLGYGGTAAVCYSNIVSYCQARQSAGWQVAIVTVLPRSDAGTPVGYETERASLNSNIRTNYNTFSSALIDVASDSRIGDAGDELDTTYYQADKVHLNATGAGIVASWAKTNLSNLLPW